MGHLQRYISPIGFERPTLNIPLADRDVLVGRHTPDVYASSPNDFNTTHSIHNYVGQWVAIRMSWVMHSLLLINSVFPVLDLSSIIGWAEGSS